MVKASREFQIFVKPNGAVCNMACQYCYYLDKGQLYPEEESFRMSDDILEDYIVLHMNAYPQPEYPDGVSDLTVLAEAFGQEHSLAFSFLQN